LAENTATLDWFYQEAQSVPADLAGLASWLAGCLSAKYAKGLSKWFEFSDGLLFDLLLFDLLLFDLLLFDLLLFDLLLFDLLFDLLVDLLVGLLATYVAQGQYSHEAN
jgi:hypothetical protein